MKLHYSSKQVKQCCTDFKIAVKKIGLDKARLLIKRIDQLRSMDNLSSLMNSGLDNPHFEENNLKGIIGWNITASYRLIIDPLHPMTKDLYKEESKITEVEIMGVVDYHGKERNNWIIS